MTIKKKPRSTARRNLTGELRAGESGVRLSQEGTMGTATTHLAPATAATQKPPKQTQGSDATARTQRRISAATLDPYVSAAAGKPITDAESYEDARGRTDTRAKSPELRGEGKGAWTSSDKGKDPFPAYANGCGEGNDYSSRKYEGLQGGEWKVWKSGPTWINFEQKRPGEPVEIRHVCIGADGSATYTWNTPEDTDDFEEFTVSHIDRLIPRHRQLIERYQIEIPHMERARELALQHFGGKWADEEEWARLREEGHDKIRQASAEARIAAMEKREEEELQRHAEEYAPEVVEEIARWVLEASGYRIAADGTAIHANGDHRTVAECVRWWSTPGEQLDIIGAGDATLRQYAEDWLRVSFTRTAGGNCVVERSGELLAIIAAAREVKREGGRVFDAARGGFQEHQCSIHEYLDLAKNEA